MIADFIAPGRRPFWQAAGIAVLLLFAANEAAWAGPQTFNTALPIAPGEFVYRQQFLIVRKSGDPTPANRVIEAFGSVSVLGYGVTPQLALFGVLPYFEKRVDLTMGGKRVGRSTRGIGDAKLFGRYTVYQKDMRGSTLRISPILGIKLPTGDDNDRDSLGRLPRTLQLGSGSWDVFAGVVETWQNLDYHIDSQVSYKTNATANGFRFGDEARLDGSFQYRLLPRTLGGGVPHFLLGGLELNLIHQGKNQLGGINDPNSGGTTLFLDPSLQYVTKRWVAEAIVQLPAVQNLNGTAVREDYAVQFGFRVNF